MEYKIEFILADTDDNRDVIRMLNAQQAYNSIYKIRQLALEGINAEEIEEMELLALLQEIMNWTDIEGLY